ncbi:ABC transporter substrate-binding protein [Catenibacillus scindens]|uniref:ABC transporter substrate-binding protein n=1 Tax=Catenibacillus scindens TaxID=673271 RepID=UPI003209DA1E
MKMKKVMALALLAAMALSMAACGSSAGNSGETLAQTESGAPAQSENQTQGEAQESGTAEASDVQTVEDGKLIMATEAGFAPYEYTEDGSTVVGVDVDIANEIAKAMGKELVIQNMFFDGALLAVQQGKADFAAAGISVNEERDKVMDFSVEYATSRQVVVVNKETMAVSSVDAITADNKVGVQTGTVADTYAQEQGWQVTQYSKFMEAAMDLMNNRLDCIVMDALPAEQLVAQNDSLTILDGELFTDKYAIAVNEGNTALLDEINAVLEQLIADGKIDEYTLNHTTGE